jgi:hypothetical protein
MGFTFHQSKKANEIKKGCLQLDLFPFWSNKK